MITRAVPALLVAKCVVKGDFKKNKIINRINFVKGRKVSIRVSPNPLPFGHPCEYEAGVLWIQ